MSDRTENSTKEMEHSKKNQIEILDYSSIYETKSDTESFNRIISVKTRISESRTWLLKNPIREK